MAGNGSLEIRCAVEIREDQSRTSPGRLVGVLMRYASPASDRRERFAPGALHWHDGGIVINEQHNRQAPIMRVIPEERGGAVVVDAQLPDTQRGRDAATSVRNGTLTGLSVEFVAESEGRAADGFREVRRALLVSAGLVDDPSYGDALVAVRARDYTKRRRTWL